jgi:hypothetical protein
MRTILFVVAVAGCAAFAGAQTVSAPEPAFNVLAESVHKDGGVVQLDGHVRIAACSIVTTDHATARGHEIELGGNAHMTLTNGIDPLK